VVAARDPDARLWMVVHVDLHGTGGIVREGLEEGEARAIADAYEAKGHHQAYQALAYTPGTRSATLARERVLE
jgi:hypothetical protein